MKKTNSTNIIKRKMNPSDQKFVYVIRNSTLSYYGSYNSLGLFMRDAYFHKVTKGEYHWGLLPMNTCEINHVKRRLNACRGAFKKKYT